MFFKFEKEKLYLLCPHGSVMQRVGLNSTVEGDGCRLKLKRHRRGYHKGRLYLQHLNSRGVEPVTLHTEGYFEVTPGGGYHRSPTWPIPAETWD